jgi:molecular chaperone DnaJ
LSPKPPPISKKSALAILGLSGTAAQEDIHRAYRRLAFEFHPDRHAGQPEMEARFKEIGEAYRALISGAGEDAPPTPDASDNPPARGRDLHFDIMVDFLEAAAGGEVGVRIQRPFACPDCGGSPGLSEASGEEPCKVCGGAGEIFEEALVNALLPSGLEDGEKVRVPMEGAPGSAGGRPGDLILTVTSARHPALERRGLDVHSEVGVPRFRLIAGGTVRVFTVRGAAHVEIPPRTAPGRTFRLKGWGIQRRQGGRPVSGDHIVRIVEMPSKPHRR